jgi:hypothetical protein
LPAGYQQQAEVNCFRLLITVQIELGVSSKLPITRLGKYLAAARETEEQTALVALAKLTKEKNTKLIRGCLIYTPGLLNKSIRRL